MAKTIEIPRMAGSIARDRRRSLGLTQREVAEKSGVSERTVYSFELGDKPGIHFDNVLDIFKALGLELCVQERDCSDASAPQSAEDIAKDFIAHIRGGADGGL